MLVGVPREITPDERRVALIPDLVASLKKAGLEITVEPGAGALAGFPDATYEQAGAKLQDDLLGTADIVLKVRAPTAEESARLKEGATLIGLLSPATNQVGLEALAARKVISFSMERMPRITRAQSMDVLSAMSTVMGYKAALMAAMHLPKFFPLLMTAAGTITPAKVFVIGAGV